MRLYGAAISSRTEVLLPTAEAVGLTKDKDGRRYAYKDGRRFSYGRDMMTAIHAEVPPMSRIQRLARNQVSAETGAIYDRYLRERGNVPNFFRTMANRPEIFQTMIAHFEAILTTGTLTTKLKELLIVRTSQLNHCEYCLASHTQIALKLGWSKAQIDALGDAAASGLFTEAEVAALHLAEKMTLAANDYSDAEFATLRSFYSEGEVVELLTAIGIFNYFNRFNNVLKMEPTKPMTEEEIVAGGYR
jgi:uncharacterized peroxidase-related enzyme